MKTKKTNAVNYKTIRALYPLSYTDTCIFSTYELFQTIFSIHKRSRSEMIVDVDLYLDWFLHFAASVTMPIIVYIQGVLSESLFRITKGPPVKFILKFK